MFNDQGPLSIPPTSSFRRCVEVRFHVPPSSATVPPLLRRANNVPPPVRFNVLLGFVRLTAAPPVAVGITVELSGPARVTGPAPFPAIDSASVFVPVLVIGMGLVM